MPERPTVAIPTCHANDSDATLVATSPTAPHAHTLIFSDDPAHAPSYTLAPADGGAPVYRVLGGRRTELWRGNGTYVGAYARGLGGGTVDRAGGALKAGKWLVKAPRSADPVLDMDLAPMQFTSGGETFVWYQHPGGSICYRASEPIAWYTRLTIRIRDGTPTPVPATMRLAPGAPADDVVLSWLVLERRPAAAGSRASRIFTDVGVVLGAAAVGLMSLA